MRCAKGRATVGKDFHVFKLQIIREDEAEGSRRAGQQRMCLVAKRQFRDADFLQRSGLAMR
jgi:hypothetical protein